MDNGSILYDWAGGGIPDSMRFSGMNQLNGGQPYDVIIVGAGLVGSALAFKLSQFQLSVLLLDKEYFIGEGTSKANSAILTAGFDTEVGSLETKFCKEASAQWPEVCRKLKLPYEQCGTLIVAVDAEEAKILEGIYQHAMTNEVHEVQLLDRDGVIAIEPNITPHVTAGLLSPTDAIGDPFSTAFAFAEVALKNGVDILLGASAEGVDIDSDGRKSVKIASGHTIKTKILANVSGLGSRRLADQYDGDNFDINPRRGQFLILDRASRPLVNRTVMPVPNPAKGRGVLVIPTIFGGLLAGPTAEDLPYGTENPTDTTVEVLQSLLPNAAKLVPALLDQPVIGAFAGARCNCSQGSYLIRYNDGHAGILTVTGVRSTGFSTSISLADHLVSGLASECGLVTLADPNAVDNRPESSWPGWWKKRFEDTDMISETPDYGRMSCTCENVSYGDIMDALKSPLKPITLNAIKRITLGQMGRCQGFGCQIKIAELVSEYHNIPLAAVTRDGPGSELAVTMATGI